MEWTWIDTPEQLADYCDAVDADLAIDTESDHFFGYRPQCCLIQLGTETDIALVDAMALDSDDLEPLVEICEDPSVEKLLHSAANDILELHRDFGFTFTQVFDTQIAAQFVGLSLIHI